ncbi:MAG TPA: hypothetical protein VEW06_01610 [Xanthobacteraceae bacterium]|nr:hypothetical protein [Xanthobacteraceae bacterium]
MANRICTPGMSATGAWLRRLGLAPNVFTYQAWLSGIAAFRQEEVDVLVPDRNALLLVLQDFDLQAVRRGDIGLIRPVVAARLHRHARGLPPRDGVLDVLHDEADMIHHRAVGARGRRRSRIAQIQHHDHAGEPHDVEHASFDVRATHPDEDLLVGLHIDRVKMPVAHGHAHVVRRVGLRPGRSHRQVRHEP